MDGTPATDIISLIDRRAIDAIAGMRKLLELHRTLRSGERDKVHAAIKDLALLLEQILPLTRHEGAWMDLERRIAVIDKAQNGWR